MNGSTPDAADRGRRSSTTLAAFLIGLPLAAVVLGGAHYAPVPDYVARYVKHEVEWVEVVLFCCALGTLVGKLWQSLAEGRACRANLLPSWDGKPVPVADAPKLLAGMRRSPRRLQNTYLGQRVAAVLEFLYQRKTAADLDDQLRSLADADAGRMENSYALTRFITWAIPILGFLGTVLGITGAISGVTPEILEKSMSSVTDGLAYAFDATALALGLTMIAMFLSFLVERREQGVLEAVDDYIDRCLAHRFQRVAPDASPVVEAVQQTAETLLRAMGQMVEKQMDLWSRALAETEKRTAAVLDQPREQLAGALQTALDRSLEAHTQRAAAVESRSVEQSGRLLEQMAALAAAVRDTGREQQAALTRVAEGIAGQAAVLGRLQEGEKDLIHLQAVLHQNLAALASAGSFDQAVHNLTAVIHLLTARTTAAPSGGAPGPRPGKAA